MHTPAVNYKMSFLDKAQGALIGLAIGDALGTTLEFSSRQRAQTAQIEMVGGGPFSLPPGYWTDDTSMALCLADSLIEKGFNTKDQMDRYVQWYDNGYRSSTDKCFDIGRTTLRSLALYKKTANPECGIAGESAAGNGSIMRLAPIVIWAFKYGLKQTIHYAVTSSKTTHGNQECLDACAYLSEILYLALDGATKETILAPKSDFTQSIATKIFDFYNLTSKTAPNTGYVIDTLRSALWAFGTTDDFESGMTQVIRLGGDADTIGAVYGQIAGTYYGLDRIPKRWKKELYLSTEILKIAEKLSR